MSVNDLIQEGVSLFKSNNFNQAIAKFNQALDEIEDKNSQLEEQNNIHSWLGGCYFEQARKVGDITEAKRLFAQAIEHHREQIKLAKQLTDKQTGIQKQNNAQFGLGRCYFEQALKIRDITEAKGLFAQAIEHHREQIKLAKQLTDKQTGIQKQNNAQFGLGRCYFEQALKVRDTTEAKGLFAQAIEHHQEQLKLAKQLTDEQTRIQKQNNAQFLLGLCYFEQARKVGDITEAKRLFAQAIEHHQEWLKLAEQLTDEQTGIQEQNNAQFWLGRCYLEQALKVRDITEAKGLFAQAIEHHQEWLKLAEQLTEEQTGIQKQINAHSWLGRCYLEQARKVGDITEAKRLFAQAIEHHQEWLKLAEQLTDEQTRIQKQINAHSWLGGCYFEQAMKVKNIAEAKDLFAKAVDRHYKHQLQLAEQLTDEQTRIQQQIHAQSWLGRCYFEQAIRTKDITNAKDLFEKAINHHYKHQLQLAEQLTDEQTRIQQQIYAQFWLGRCYFSQATKIEDKLQTEILIKDAEGYFLGSLELLPLFDNEQERKRVEKIIYHYLRNICFLRSNWILYFNKKKQDISKALFSDEDNNLDGKLKEAISTILAVLNIPPIELGSTPLAHYTSSTVCNKLFGVVHEDDSSPMTSPMRIGSSTYMNDPSEGKGLLELLSLQDLELENKADCSPHNAFFACFSARVNDLNQFRLYGKEDGVEASGCCLVFNKNRDWLKEPDISAPFRSFLKNLDENSAEFKETDISNVEYEKLPLYQVAYIAYKDEYIAEEKCERWLDNSFGICLKPIGENKVWHNFRLDQLKEALQELVGFFKEKDHVNDKNKNALEYIRYLFKDFAFRDEEEFRVLKMAEIGSEEIEYCKTTKSIYLPYADISYMVDEVILGTNYEKTHIRYKAEVFQHQMKQKCPYVKVSRSSLPIYANPPIKKD